MNDERRYVSEVCEKITACRVPQSYYDCCGTGMVVKSWEKTGQMPILGEARFFYGWEEDCHEYLFRITKACAFFGGKEQTLVGSRTSCAMFSAAHEVSFIKEGYHH